jgi:hypothetical protein
MPDCVKSDFELRERQDNSAFQGRHRPVVNGTDDRMGV